MPRLFVVIALLFLALAGTAPAATASFLSEDKDSRLSTIPHDAAFEKALQDAEANLLAVRHEGYNETLATWARLKVHELTGRTAIHGQDPMFTVLSLMYERQRWFDAKFLPIEHPRVGELLGVQGKWVSPKQVLSSEGLEELETQVRAAALDLEELQHTNNLLRAAKQVDAFGADRPDVFEKVATETLTPDEVRGVVVNPGEREGLEIRRKALAKKVNESKAFRETGHKLMTRVQLVATLPEQFLIVPDPEDPQGTWVAPNLELAPRFADAGNATVQQVSFGLESGPSPLEVAAARLDEGMALAFLHGEASELTRPIEQFRTAVERSRHYPNLGDRQLLNFYVLRNPYRATAWIYGLGAVLFGFFAFFRAKAWRWAAVGVLVVGFVAHTGSLVLRWHLSGHVPVSNMFESITFTAWAALAFGLAFELWKKNGLMGLFACCFGFLALVLAGLMPLHDTRLHPLRAVLNSYWLNIHVTMMLISYGAFALSAFFALLYLVKLPFARRGREALFGGKPLMPLEQTEEFAYRLVQVGWPLLTVGVMLGAVWADTAWGRYWGWDPKETWALITWIVYTIYLHTRMVMGWRGSVSAAACVAGFVMVLITWLGVSYIPWFAGGLHSYASPT